MIYIISDMHGFNINNHGEHWLSKFTEAGQVCQLLSLPELAKIPLELLSQGVEEIVHDYYLQTGLSQAILELKKKNLKSSDIIVGFSMGGYLAFLLAKDNSYTCPINVLMISTTRLRHEKTTYLGGARCSVLYGLEDKNAATNDQLFNLKIGATRFPGEHTLYHDPEKVWPWLVERI